MLEFMKALRICQPDSRYARIVVRRYGSNLSTLVEKYNATIRVLHMQFRDS